jgi:hypothetical protein
LKLWPIPPWRTACLEKARDGRTRHEVSCKLNDVDPQAWLADVLARIADDKINDLAALLPWNRRLARMDRAA